VGTQLNANQATLICSRTNVSAVTITVATSAGNVQADLDAIPPPPSVTSVIMKALPRGTILAWTDMSVAIPDGWHLADGTNGTVNLVGRVPMGVDDQHVMGRADEGSLMHTHAFTKGQATNQESQGSVAQDPHPGGGQPVGQAGHTHPLSGVVTDPFSTLPPVTRVYFIQKIT
jgi:hypothetical protein